MRRRSFLTATLCLFVAPVSAEAIESGDGRSANAGPTVGETARVQYEGWVGGFPGQGDRRRRRVQGDFHALNFERRPGRAVRYRVCLRGGNLAVRSCFRRRSGSGGRSSVNVSLWLNDRGGPGNWKATWFVRHKAVASWRFTLVPESV